MTLAEDARAAGVEDLEPDPDWPGWWVGHVLDRCVFAKDRLRALGYRVAGRDNQEWIWIAPPEVQR